MLTKWGDNQFGGMLNLANKFHGEEGKPNKLKKQLNKHQCYKNKVVTWEKKEWEDVSDEDNNYQSEQTPTHQEDHCNQDKEWSKSDMYHVNQCRYQEESSKDDEEVDWHV